MGRGDRIGEFEELVLMAVAILGEEAYGLGVRDFLAGQTGRKSALGAIHATLYRLQDKGLLDSGMEGAKEERGGRRKRVFEVTSAGKAAVQEARQARERIWDMVPSGVMSVSSF
ncbi:MAG: PadR family transcriptional regulator [Bacteroidetes bacterium]|nr:PadR family transcriptional regulator [Bacteroidota bacterium]